MKIEKSASVPIGGNAGALKKFLDAVPDYAAIRFVVSRGDRPWESDSLSVTANWSEEI